MDSIKLLKTWCDGLIARQTENAFDKQMNGGFLCPACKSIHGRGDNAIYPFYCAFSLTRDEKYRKAARLCFDFHQNYICSDGGVFNDGTVTWKGITVFSAISYLKTLINFKEYVENLNEFEERTKIFCKWVYENLDENYGSNINYQCAAALCMALAGEYFKNEAYICRAEKLLAYGMEHFTQNGLLYGEAQPHNTKSKKGCVAIDIGYNVEESVPALSEAAVVLKDRAAQDFFANVLLKQLDFMLPDGAWDNSFTCRNYKWTYYGSRTSDGCAGVYAMYSGYNPAFLEAAKRNLALMEKCTFSGLLAGGPEYQKAGEKTCVHHTFTHAVALTDFIVLNTEEKNCSAPMDDFSDRVKYYPELDSYKVYKNGFLADFSCYDINRNSMTGGVGFARGGSMTLLYHKEKGLISLASLFAYPPLAEPTNQQLSLNCENIASLTPRAQTVKNGVIFSTALYNDAAVSVQENKVIANTAFSDIKGNVIEDVTIEYTFNEKSVGIAVIGTNYDFVFPLIGNADISSGNEYEKKKIFSFVGGFIAEKYTFKSKGGRVEITIEI